MGDEDVAATQFGNRLERLLRMVAMKVPARLIAGECILIAEAACRIPKQVPIDMRIPAARLYKLIEEECAKPEIKAHIEHVRQEVAAMGEEVHTEGCPAYEMWIKMSMPAAPGECTCGGAKRENKQP